MFTFKTQNMQNHYYVRSFLLTLIFAIISASLLKAQNNVTLTPNCNASTVNVSGYLASNNRINILLYKDNAIVSSASDLVGPSFNQNISLSGPGSYQARVLEVNNDGNYILSAAVAVNCSGSNPNPPTTPSPPSGTCNFSQGQFLVNWYGDMIYANYYNGVLYAANQDGVNGFKPRHWLVATGQFTQEQANCFASEDPHTTTGGGNPNPPTNPNPPSSGNCSVSSPVGAFDNADCNVVSGWALDQSDFSKTVTVDIYVDGSLLASVQANGDRPDVASHFGNSAARYHGYSYSVPANASWKNGQNHNITVRICGTSNDLNGPKTVNCSGGSTNPTNPTNPNARVRAMPDNDPNLYSNWDWTVSNYGTIYYQGASGVTSLQQVLSPFWDGSQRLVGNTGDMYPQDGWMLVNRDFGTPDAAVDYPYFMLYNKFTGNLRVAILRTAPRGTVGSYQLMTLRFADSSPSPRPALFTFVDPDINKGTIQSHNGDIVQYSLVKDVGINEWIVSDFSVAGYDPNIPQLTQLVLSLDEVEELNGTINGNLTLDGKVTGQPNGTLDKIQGVTDFGDKTFSKLEDILGIFKTSFQKGASGVFGVISAGIDVINAFTGSGGTYNVKLNGTVNLGATLKANYRVQNIPFYLKQQASGYNVRPVQNIPWGVLNLRNVQNGNGLVSDLNGINVQVSPFGPNRCCRTFTAPNISFKDPVNTYVNPAIGIQLSEVRAVYINSVGTGPVPLSSSFGYTEPAANPYNFNKVGIAYVFQPSGTINTTSEGVVLYKVYPGPAVTYNYQGGARIAADGDADIAVTKLAYPNPFNEEVNIPVSELKIGVGYKMQIVSADGKVVWTSEGTIDESTQSLKWNGTDKSGRSLSPGMYMSTIEQVGNKPVTHKLLLQR
jgi:hypothetical protein